MYTPGRLSPATRIGPKDASAKRRTLRILIADDEPDTVATLSEILRDEGFDVQSVYSGKDALVAIREFDPDVAILDIAMPGMTGWDVARTVRSDGPRPILIAISGQYTKGADRVLAQMAGFNYYLVKPCDPNVLIALLAPISSK